jgi:hypothetical protein
MIFYVKSETNTSTLFIEAGADGYDTMLGFRQDFTTIFSLGHDDSDDLFKIIAGSSLSGTAAISVGTSNEVRIPNLGVTGESFNINGDFTMNTAGPGTGGRIDLKNQYGKIYNYYQEVTATGTYTIVSQAPRGSMWLITAYEDSFDGASSYRHIVSLVTIVHNTYSGSDLVYAAPNNMSVNGLGIGSANGTPSPSSTHDGYADITITGRVSSSSLMRVSALRIG